MSTTIDSDVPVIGRYAYFNSKMKYRVYFIVNTESGDQRKSIHLSSIHFYFFHYKRYFNSSLPPLTEYLYI